MTRPRLLDVYSCAGGASMGYHRAGFDVVGVDIDIRSVFNERRLSMIRLFTVD